MTKIPVLASIPLTSKPTFAALRLTAGEGWLIPTDEQAHLRYVQEMTAGGVGYTTRLYAPVAPPKDRLTPAAWLCYDRHRPR